MSGVFVNIKQLEPNVDFVFGDQGNYRDVGGPTVKKIQLGNGLRVVMEQIPTCRSVSFGIWVKTGSRNEQPVNNGVSHFIEHMLFKGTDRYDAKAIAEQFDAIGGNVNAFTSKEYTCYYAKVLDEHLPIAVDVLSDMFSAPKWMMASSSKRKRHPGRDFNV